MPQARKSARSTSRAGATYKEPAAIKRLNTSLDGAQKALKELQSSAGRNAADTTKALHKGIGKFLTDARRDAGKFGTALKRDFEAAQKAAKRTTAAATGGRASGRSSSRTTASRGTKSSTARASKPARKTASKAASKPRARASTSRSTRKKS